MTYAIAGLTAIAIGLLGFVIGYLVRHGFGIARELGAWQEGYYWGGRHEAEDGAWTTAQLRAMPEAKVPPMAGGPEDPRP